MPYRTLRQAASEASMPEDRAGYEDMMSTPEGRAKANLIAMGIGGAGMLGAKAIAAAPSLSSGTIRQWLATRAARAAAPEAVLMEPAAGVAARDAIARGSIMSPSTAGATMIAGLPAMARRPTADQTNFSVPLPEGPTRDPQDVIMDQVRRDREADFQDENAVPNPNRAALLEKSNFHDENAVPNPQRARMPLPVKRPAALDAAPQSFLGRIFSGEDYQSSNALASDPRLAGYTARVVQDGKINWGDRDNAADFFRADAARMAMEKKAAEEGEGKAKGGAVAGKDAALHKALEIIHHLLTRGH